MALDQAPRGFSKETGTASLTGCPMVGSRHPLLAVLISADAALWAGLEFPQRVLRPRVSLPGDTDNCRCPGMEQEKISSLVEGRGTAWPGAVGVGEHGLLLGLLKPQSI